MQRIAFAGILAVAVCALTACWDAPQDAGAEAGPTSSAAVDRTTDTSGDPSGSPAIVTIAVPAGPSTEYAAYGSIWVLTQDNTSTLQRIDPTTNRVTGSVSLGYGETAGNDTGLGAVASADGALWVAEYFYNTVLRIDPRRMIVTDTVRVGRSPAGVVGVGNTVFVTDSHASAVQRIDAATDRVVATIAVGDRADFDGGPLFLAYAEGRVWTDVPAQHRLYAIDPATDRVVASPTVTPAIGCGPLVPAPGGIWLDDSGCSATFSRYDASTGRVTSTVTIPPTACRLLGIGVLGSHLFSAEARTPSHPSCQVGSLVQRDLVTGAVQATIPVPVPDVGVFGLDGSLWTNDADSNTHVLRVTPGGTR